MGKSWRALCAAGLACLAAAAAGEAGRATLQLDVADEQGRPLAFRVETYKGSRRVAASWSDTGSQQLAVPPDADTLIVRHGFDYDAVEQPLACGPGETVRKRLTLKRRFDAKALGWYCGESHMHGQHSKNDQPATFKDGARLAAADGLDYLQIGFAWEPSFSWPSGEQLDAWAREATTRDVTVLWNCETPKCYMSEDDGGKRGNLHCYGHGLAYGLRDISKGKEFFFTGPNFRIMQEIRRQNGAVVCAHPVRFWFNNGNFVSNWASELPFDFVAGVPYAGVDILNDCPLLFFQSEHLWWNLLNMGYKVSGTANSDGNLSGGQGVGRFRTYNKLDGPFAIEKVVDALKKGACVASSGPFVLFQVDGKDPGAEFPADGKRHKATIRAWGGPLPGESLVSVQLVRNGEIVRAWDLRDENTREWETTVKLSDRDFAWYAVRVTALSRNREGIACWGPNLYELAVASPVYFIPRGFERPKSSGATVTLSATNEAGQPVGGTVTVMDEEKEIATQTIPESGSVVLHAPATATLKISAPGYAEQQRSIYMDTSLFAYSRNLNELYPSFYSPETWQEIRGMLSNLKISVALKRK